MAEKGENKILVIITICIILFSILFTGCISTNEKDKEPLPYYALPIANAGENQTVYVNETVHFDSSNSSCGYKILNVTWDFDHNDGIQIDSREIKPTHTYNTPGNYTVTLTVYNPPSDGRKDTDIIIITVLPLFNY